MNSVSPGCIRSQPRIQVVYSIRSEKPQVPVVTPTSSNFVGLMSAPTRPMFIVPPQFEIHLLATDFRPCSRDHLFIQEET